MAKLWKNGARVTVEQMFQIDIRDLKKRGFLDGDYYSARIGGRHNNSVQFAISTDPNDEFLGGRFIQFWYSVADKEGNTRHYDYKIPLTTTRCHFGGVRYWFRCYANLRYCCGNRVATLFLGSVGIFACRHCYGLSYNSRNKNRRDAFYSMYEKARLEREKAQIMLSKGYRAHYAGFPTRKCERLLKINRKIEAYNQAKINYPGWFMKGLIHK